MGTPVTGSNYWLAHDIAKSRKLDDPETCRVIMQKHGEQFFELCDQMYSRMLHNERVENTLIRRRLRYLEQCSDGDLSEYMRKYFMPGLVKAVVKGHI